MTTQTPTRPHIRLTPEFVQWTEEQGKLAALETIWAMYREYRQSKQLTGYYARRLDELERLQGFYEDRLGKVKLAIQSKGGLTKEPK